MHHAAPAVRLVNVHDYLSSGRPLDRRVLSYLGGSALAHIAAVVLLAGLAIDARGLSDDALGTDGRMVSLRVAPPEPAPQLRAPSGPPGPAAAIALATPVEREPVRMKPAPRPREPAEARPGGGYAPSAADLLGDLVRGGELGRFRADDFEGGIGDQGQRGFGNDLGDGTGFGNGVERVGGDPDGTIPTGRIRTFARWGGRDGGDLDAPVRMRPRRCDRAAGVTAGCAPITKIGSATTDGDGLDRSIIRQRIRQKLASIRHCYERALIGRPDLAGTTVVRFQINPAGAVVNVSAGGLAAEVDDCVARVIETIAFPAPRGGGFVDVTRYPFTFAAAGAP